MAGNQVLIALLACCGGLAGAAPPAAAVMPPTGTYEAPVITTSDEGVSIEALRPPAGAFWRIALDPERTYRIRVSGRRLERLFTLRLRKAGGVYRYAPAPHGTEVLRASGVSEVELLFYSDTPAAYRVESIVVDDCTGSCGDGADLRRLVLDGTRGLEEDLAAGDLQAASEKILHWASPRIPFATDYPAPIPTHGKTAAELYFDNFEGAVAAVYCEGAADFLAKLLRVFDIDASVVEFGELGTPLTHAMVVRSDTEQPVGREHQLLDPTFNLSLAVDGGERPVSAEETLEIWRAGLSSYITPRTGSLDERILVGRGPAGGPARCGDAAGSSSACGLPDYTAIWGDTFAAYGYEQGLPGLIQLLGLSELANVEFHGVPQEFVRTRETFKQAVLEGRDEERIALLPIRPVNQRLPRIVGEPVIGYRLEAAGGAWLTDYALSDARFVWVRCDRSGSQCQDVATGPTYAIASADSNHTLQLVEFRENVFGEGSGSSAVTAVVPPSPELVRSRSAGASPALHRPSSPRSLSRLVNTLARQLRRAGRGRLARGLTVSVRSRSAGRLLVRVRCAQGSVGTSCATGAVDLRSGRPVRLTLKPTRGGRRLLRRQRSLRVSLVVELRVRGKSSQELKRRLRLRP